MAVTNLEQFCEGFKDLLKGKPDISTLIRTGRTLLSELMSQKEWFGNILKGFFSIRNFPKAKSPASGPTRLLCTEVPTALS